MISETEKAPLSPKIELTNMVMIEDEESGWVLVQERIKSWKGLSFPGGHIEPGESFVNSAIREVKEETGLDIKNLQFCGTVHWVHRTRLDRYVVMLYKSSSFSGKLLDATEEGRVFWISLDKLKNSAELSNNFREYITVFTNDEISEYFGSWSEGEKDSFTFK